MTLTRHEPAVDAEAGMLTQLTAPAAAGEPFLESPAIPSTKRADPSVPLELPPHSFTIVSVTREDAG